MEQTIEYCPNCGTMAMITYESQGEIHCAVCGAVVVVALEV